VQRHANVVVAVADEPQIVADGDLQQLIPCMHAGGGCLFAALLVQQIM